MKKGRRNENMRRKKSRKGVETARDVGKKKREK